MRHRILNQLLASDSKLSTHKLGTRVVLLQGPVGPFFNALNKLLKRNNFFVWRICFNAGDHFFSTSSNRIDYKEGLEKWQDWFATFLSEKSIDCIILFGSEREIHSIARQVAKQANIRVISLEEGYIRPGFITVEEDGNNASSPLLSKAYSVAFEQNLETDPPLSGKDFKGTTMMVVFGAIYYTMRTFCTDELQKKLFHRNFNYFHEIFYWVRNTYRKMVYTSKNARLINDLILNFDKQFYLVPLQVSADCNLKKAAMGWNTLKLIQFSLKSFSLHAPKNSRLIFKIHPLERGHTNVDKLINNICLSLGIQDRVDVLHTGSLGKLASHAAGMITINSTSGLSAIAHGIPLLVIGKAFYCHPNLVICGNGNPDFDSFWSHNYVASSTFRKNYINWVRQEALVAGDFYSLKGIKIGCDGILSKLQNNFNHKEDHSQFRHSKKYGQK